MRGLLQSSRWTGRLCRTLIRQESSLAAWQRPYWRYEGGQEQRHHQRHSTSWDFARPALALVPLSGAALIHKNEEPEEPRTLQGIRDKLNEGIVESDFLSVDANKRNDKGPVPVWKQVWKAFKRFVIEPLSTARRFIHLALLFIPVLMTSPILLLELIDTQADKMRRRPVRHEERSTTRWWFRLLVAQMARAGPTFIKLAQWAGSRTDLFPKSLCDLFGQLHSRGKPHSMRYTRKVIERAFGKPFEEIFDSFNETPVGVGAIAQVYTAVVNEEILPTEYLDPKHVHDAGAVKRVSKKLIQMSNEQRPPEIPSTAVAIKVTHPGIEKMITRDLKIMMFFAKILNALPGMQWLSFPEEVSVFGQMMMSQIDLRLEAGNLVTFEHNFRHHPTINFPRALKSYTSPKVLVEEYEYAVPLESFLKNKGGIYDKRIANLGLDAFLTMLLIHNFTHGDLHPGNIFVKFYKPTTKSMFQSLWAGWKDIPEGDPASDPENKDSVKITQELRKLKDDESAFHQRLEELDLMGYQPEIVFIDAGLVVHLNDTNRRNFLDLFGAVAQFDGYRAGRLMVERCRTPELVIDEEGFSLKMQHLILGVKSQTFSLAKIKIADVLSQVLTNVRTHHVKLEADFVNTVLSILLLEGIGRQLDPDMDLFKSALPIMRQLGKQFKTTDIMNADVDVKGLGTMLKVWVWIEARQMAEVAVGEVDDWIRYDQMMPAV